MPIFDYNRDILIPIKTRLDGDARFGGRGLTVYYDRSDDRQMPLDHMPGINYFLLSPWDDTSIGVGNYSVQNRLYTIAIGLCLWVFNPDAGAMEETLSQLGGDLFDFLREYEYWDQTRQILIKQSIAMDIDYPVTADGVMVGAQLLRITFDQYAP